MLGVPLRYWLKHPAIAITEMAADPLEIWTTIRENYVAGRVRRGPQHRHEADAK